MEQITHLQPRAAKPGVFQSASIVVPCHPEGEHPLVGLAELARAGDHAAAVDHYTQPAVSGVFLAQQFGREFAGAVVRARAIAGKLLRDAGIAGPGQLRRPLRQVQARRRFDQRQGAQGGDRVNARTRQKHQPAATLASVFQTIERATQVGVEHIARRAANAGMHTGFGRGLDEHVERAVERLKILPVAHIAMDKLCTQCLQAREI